MTLLVSILPWIQIGLSIGLVVVILLQQNEAGIGAAFGGSGGDGFQRTKRGAEKVFFNITIVLAILFALSALAALFTRSLL